jgi:hypothetical protein
MSIVEIRVEVDAVRAILDRLAGHYRAVSQQVQDTMTEAGRLCPAYAWQL